MELSNLKPFLRTNLDILFIGLNPADGSNKKGHYFSVNQSFWSQLFGSNLISKEVSKDIADDLIFGSNKLNYNHWNYGITDLVTKYAESNSSIIRPTVNDIIRVKSEILNYKPKTVVILHSKVLKCIFQHLNKPTPNSNSGSLGKLFPLSKIEFFNIAFPHGNSISSADKIEKYKELRNNLSKNEF